MDSRVEDKTIVFGPVDGKKGEKKTLVHESNVLFKGTRLIAKDSAGGMCTRVVDLIVNGKSQRPEGGGGTLSLFFGENALGNGLVLDACQPGQTIELGIEFIEDGIWEGKLEGKAAL